MIKDKYFYFRVSEDTYFRYLQLFQLSGLRYKVSLFERLVDEEYFRQNYEGFKYD